MSSITLPVLALRTALAGLTKVVNRRCTLPVLAYLKIERRNGAVHLTGTDLDVYLTYSHTTEPPPITALAKSLAALRWQREAATILVPLDTLRHAAKSASGTDPWVTLTPDTASWSTPGGAVSMPFTPIPAKEFPEIPSAPFCRTNLDAATRSALVEAHTYSSKDETRYVLNGVYIEVQHGEAACPPVAVATDGRRLYRRRVPALASIGGNIILPNKALTVLSAAPLLAHEWRIGASRNTLRAAVKAGPWSLVTKLIEGNYPNYRQVIHTDFTHWITAVLPAAQVKFFASALAQFPATNKPPIALVFHGDHLRLQCLETNTAVVVPGIRSDAPLAILFDRHYVREMLGLGAGTLFLFDASTPCHLAAASGAEHVLMPYSGEIKVTVPDPERDTLEAMWKDRRVSITEPGENGAPPETSEGLVLGIPRQGLRIDSARVHFDGEKNPCTVPIAGLTLLPPKPAEEAAAA